MIEGPSNLLITGAGQGIGRALARHFAAKGHKLYLMDINGDGLKHTVETHLKEHSDRIGYAEVNLADTQSVRDGVAKAAKFLSGQIDYVVANAGISSPYWRDGATMADPSTLDQWKTYVDVNLTGNFALAQAVLPYMKVHAEDDRRKLPDSHVGGAGPCIVFTSSFRGIISDPNQEGYAATKAGLIGLTSAMAVSMQHFGIRVNCVSPGRIKAQHESKKADENGGKWEVEGNDAEVHLSNRAGMPEDISEAVEYLLGAGFGEFSFLQSIVLRGSVPKATW
ncbi:uncharacterized protein HMPREF1541_04044 [Cyphellophora europaea CBS 101466]|uniref:NAD(P)-binding protein n=1 Tax=Cyphellophora europaea (strain CBS 101466) TaxID=1220924 RepID=W2S0I5_CYPE1|nr:uncharacterized protein HMPREF1541_04044 [Cyphellophora europaea CBS 101466]ETN42105.1 hypothetical protein HMPREF1541_04044 [Cyphellophora europaea CBS 101466]